MKLLIPGNKTFEATFSGNRHGKRAREDNIATDEPPTKSPRLDNDEELDTLFEDESEEADTQIDDQLFSDEGIQEANNLVDTNPMPADAPQASRHQASDEEPSGISDEELERILRDFNETSHVFQPDAITSNHSQEWESPLNEFSNFEGFGLSFTNGDAHTHAATSEVERAVYPNGLTPPPWLPMDMPAVVPELVHSSSSNDSPPSPWRMVTQMAIPEGFHPYSSSGLAPTSWAMASPEIVHSTSAACLTPVSDPSAHIISPTKKSGPGRPRTNPKRNESEPKRPIGRPRKDAAPKRPQDLAPRSGPVEHTAPDFNPQAHQTPTPAPEVQDTMPLPMMQAYPLPEGRPSNEGPRLTFFLLSHGYKTVEINKDELCRHSALIRNACRTEGKVHWPPNTLEEPENEDTWLLAELLYNESADICPMTNLCTPAVWEALAKMVHENGDGRLEAPDIDGFIVDRKKSALHFLFVAQVHRLMKWLQMDLLADRVFLNTIEPAWRAYSALNSLDTDGEVYSFVELDYQKASENYYFSSETFASYYQMDDGMDTGNMEELVTNTGAMY